MGGLSLHIRPIDIAEIPKNASLYEVTISDITPVIGQIITDMLDTSWINKMDIIDRKAYEAKAIPTIDKIVNNIFKKINNEVTEDAGEYLISFVAQYSLESECEHKRIVLAEVFGKRVSGNSGFDFHTECSQNVLSFGEAKYSSNNNPYDNAINQINTFIKDKKDDQDLSDLRHFVSKESLKNYTDNGKKAYIAAFSLNAVNKISIFKKVLDHKDFKKLLKYHHVYVFGIVTNA
ncbi:hypothetical protein [Seleniivibrio woodruffii]|uniref:Anti-bacteriophage protein A/HamA C-terminal domain-containing protein n=1 Tax=Seleniivibrio woodruffii TaxID=1078050 RepID=A0A4R1K9S8_9BACT|nr:hypothetical protein [Seleniivibrio woodruffii]TCK59929.1 hypothetical protein C8D98_2098 [Seleniivibrio woodruffii]TVZ35850.1 hypothetical protein OF66_1468 [Seleniivibrio woodruffii]